MQEIQAFKTSGAEHTWLLGIVAAGLVVRVAAVAFLNIAPESDYLEYQTMALNLVSGRGLVDSTHNLAFYNAGYPLLVLAPVFAAFGPNLLAAQLVNACLGAAAIVCCYAVARAAGAGPVGRLLSAALLAMYLPSLIYAEYLAKENLMTPLMIGVVWCTIRLSQRLSTSLAVLCGGLFGLIALTGNAGLAFVLVAGIGLLISDARLGRKVALGAVMAMVALAVTAPWLIRNARVLGTPTLNTNGGFNLYLGNNPQATGMFMSIADTPRGATWHALREQGEVHASQTLGAEAVQWITSHPWDFVQLAFRKLRLFWTPPTHEGLGPGSTTETLIRRLWLAQFVLLIAGALVGAMWSSGQPRSLLLIWLAVAVYSGVHMLVYVIFRYREPVMPLVCVLAALAVERVANLSAQAGLQTRIGRTRRVVRLDE